MDSSISDSYYALYSPSCKPIHLSLSDSYQLPQPFPSMVTVFVCSAKPDVDLQCNVLLVNQKEPTDYFRIGTISQNDRAFCWQPCHHKEFEVPPGEHGYHLHIGTDSELKARLEGLQHRMMTKTASENANEEMDESSQTESQELRSAVVPTETKQVDHMEVVERSLMEPQHILPVSLLPKAKSDDEEMTEGSLTEHQDIVSTSSLPEADSTDSQSVESPKLQKLECKNAETTPRLQVQGTPDRPPGLSHSASKKRKAVSPADDAKATPLSARKRQSSRQRATISSPIPSSPLSSRAGHARRGNAQKTPGRGKKDATGPGPSARWGHTMCDIGKQKSLLIGGQGHRQSISKDSIWMLDTERSTWTTPPIVACSDKFPPRMGHTATFDPQIKCVFVFGGSKNLRWYNDMHVLDLDTWRWSHVEASGVAPTRAYHSCTLFRNELYIFGGVYPNPDPQPDGCSNDVFIFSPESESWYKPVTMGTKPSPRSGHSATLIGDKLVIFGGWDAPVCFNDLHILDLCLMEFTSPTVQGKPPSPRSWHSSIALHYNRILIHGGYNGNEALGDAFIFSLDTLTWSEVELTPGVPIGIRAGHTLTYFHGDQMTGADGKENNPCEYTLAVFGGGDNEENFFGDLIPFALADPDIGIST